MSLFKVPIKFIIIVSWYEINFIVKFNLLKIQFN